MKHKTFSMFVILPILASLLVVAVPTNSVANSLTSSSITPTPVPSEPIKIGAITAWSGPMAMSGVLADQIIAQVSEQVHNTGGILGGREVMFIRGDDGGTVAGAIACARKLIQEDKVSILTIGGISAASFSAVSDVAEELNVPYMALAHHLLHCGNQLSFRHWQETSLKKQEREAEECAAHILMPESELAKLGDLPVADIAEYFGVPEEVAWLRISQFATDAELVRWKMCDQID